MIGDPVAGIQEAWVTWTIPSGAAGMWQSRNLVQDGADASLWTGSMPRPASARVVRFMVQAASGIGRVMLDNNNGAFYRPGSIPGATPPTPPVETSLAARPDACLGQVRRAVPGHHGSEAGRPALGGKLVRIGLGAAVLPAFTGQRKGNGDTPRRRDTGELPGHGHLRG